MKKRLESELISIAHRILKLKNKSEVDQLYSETQKLYETLATLKFYQDNFEQLKLTISQDELESKLEKNLAKDLKISTPEIEENSELIEEELKITTSEDFSDTEKNLDFLEESKKENTEEQIVEHSKSDFDFEPIFELAAETPDERVEDKVEKIIDSKKQEPQQISFEDLLGQNYSEPVFVKPNDVSASSSKAKVADETVLIPEKNTQNTNTLNDKFATTINVGLNDRIGFVKNLFADSTEDYNRVISQLNTFDSLSEAKEFVEDMVKPDYDNWKGKEEYAERFMEILEKKFS